MQFTTILLPDKGSICNAMVPFPIYFLPLQNGRHFLYGNFDAGNTVSFKYKKSFILTFCSYLCLFSCLFIFPPPFIYEFIPLLRREFLPFPRPSGDECVSECMAEASGNSHRLFLETIKRTPTAAKHELAIQRDVRFTV